LNVVTQNNVQILLKYNRQHNHKYTTNDVDLSKDAANNNSLTFLFLLHDTIQATFKLLSSLLLQLRLCQLSQWSTVFFIYNRNAAFNVHNVNEGVQVWQEMLCSIFVDCEEKNTRDEQQSSS